MNIGISFYFGYKLKPKVSAKMIKESGFDCVIANPDKKYNKQNGTIKSQMKLFKKYNISVSGSEYSRARTYEDGQHLKEGRLESQRVDISDNIYSRTIIRATTVQLCSRLLPLF